MKIEVGKSYRTRDGSKAYITHENDCVGFSYSARVDGRSGYTYAVRGNYDVDRESNLDLVAEWVDEPKTWGEMSPEEKGALLLAKHEGKTIQLLCPVAKDWYIGEPRWHDDRCYRVKPEPEVFKVTLQGGNFRNDKDYWSFRRDGHIGEDTHKITFSLVDGEPDCGSIKMEKIRSNEE